MDKSSVVFRPDNLKLKSPDNSALTIEQDFMLLGRDYYEVKLDQLKISLEVVGNAPLFMSTIIISGYINEQSLLLQQLLIVL